MLEKKSSGSRLFLTELMFSILFFILIVAVCTQLIAKAHVLSVQSKELTGAVNACENVAEKYMAGYDVPESMILDEHFHETEDGVYSLTCEIMDNVSSEKLHIVLRSIKDDRAIYDLFTSKAVKR